MSTTTAEWHAVCPVAALTPDRGVAALIGGRQVALFCVNGTNEIFAVADRITVLRDGAYIGTREVGETSEGELIAMMVGRMVEQMFPLAEMRPGAPVLEVHGLRYRDAVRDVSFTVRAGEIVGLAGLVGSGRSELAQTLFGITPATAGEIRLMGRPVRITSPSAAKALGLAYVPEDRGLQGLVRAMSVRENVSMAVLDKAARGPILDLRRERSLALEAIRRFSIRTRGPEQSAAGKPALGHGIRSGAGGRRR